MIINIYEIYAVVIQVLFEASWSTASVRIRKANSETMLGYRPGRTVDGEILEEEESRVQRQRLWSTSLPSSCQPPPGLGTGLAPDQPASQYHRPVSQRRSCITGLHRCSCSKQKNRSLVCIKLDMQFDVMAASYHFMPGDAKQLNSGGLAPIFKVFNSCLCCKKNAVGPHPQSLPCNPLVSV